MQIVIDMPEGTFKSVKRYYEQNQECYALCAYVANGTPLPKGHGDLIDRSKLTPDTEWSDYYDDFVSYSQGQIKDAKVILEASESEGKE